MRLKLFLILAIAAAAVVVHSQVYLPHTKLTLTYSNVGVKGVLDDWWYTQSVVCSTQTGCVNVIFVVDTSGSMSDKIGELYTEIGEFAYNLESEGYDGSYGIVTFVDEPNFPAGDTFFTDPDQFSDFMADLNGAEGGLEAPIDASYEAINRYGAHWTSDTCKRVLIALTDETEEESSHPLSDLISLAESESVAIYLVSPSGHPMEPACGATGGQWFDIESTSLDEVLDAVADDIAEFTAITIVLNNTSGYDLSDVAVQLHPLGCIDMDNPADSIQHTGPMPAGGSDTITWQITEVPNCHGCEDCFWITVTADTMSDSLQGCLFVENCDCPGINANVIQPRHCGRYSACDQIVFQFDGCFPVNPNSIVIYVGGEYISYPDPRLSFNPSDQTLTYIPSTPFSDGATIEFYVSDAEDITGCQLRYSQHCSVTIDKSPPQFDSGPEWSPACGSTIDDGTIIHFAACVHDAGVGMTPFDSNDSLTDESALASIFNSIYLTINGGLLPAGGVPGLGYDFVWQSATPSGFPPSCSCDTVTHSSTIFYDGFPFNNFHIIRRSCRTDAVWPCTESDCPACSECDWQVQFDVYADDIRSLVGDPVELELCFHFQDLITEQDCGPNDTVVCCTYYFSGVSCDTLSGLSPASPYNDFSADCSLGVFVWHQPAGSTPIYYDFYLNDSLVAGDLTDTTYNLSPPLMNFTDITQTYTWFVVARNPCDTDTSAVWRFAIQPCCKPAVVQPGCPAPECFSFSSCEPQQVRFAIYDTTGQTIDISRTYFTVYVYHAGGGVDTYHITGSDSHLSWSGDTVSVYWSPVADGDSVVILIDSVYTTDGCRTIPH